MKVFVALAVCLCLVLYVTGDFVDNDETRSSDNEIEPGSSEEADRSSSRGRGHRHRGGQRHHGRHHGRHHHNRGEYGNWTEEEKVNFMCMKLTSNMTASDRFQHKFSRWSETLKAQMLQCCQMSGDERLECAQNVHNMKYDRVCSGEESMSSCMHGTSQSSSEAIRTRCCDLTGEARYKCFYEARTEAYRTYSAPTPSRGPNEDTP